MNQTENKIMNKSDNKKYFHIPHTFNFEVKFKGQPAKLFTTKKSITDHYGISRTSIYYICENRYKKKPLKWKDVEIKRVCIHKYLFLDEEETQETEKKTVE
jgi:hypothetical protein